MNLSSLVTTGPVVRPQRGIIFGTEGVGKTELATKLPEPILIDTEAGSHQFACARITVGNDHQLEAAVNT